MCYAFFHLFGNERSSSGPSSRVGPSSVRFCLLFSSLRLVSVSSSSHLHRSLADAADFAAEKKPIPFLCGALLENYLQPTSFGRRGEDGQRGYGYEVTLDDDDEQGLPAPVDVEVISSLTYFQFAIGVSIMYGCVSRIDQILLVVKELCGESYIVKGGKEEEEVGLLFAHDNNSFGTATPMH